MPFRDRVEAGRLLADSPHLRAQASDDLVVLGLPRGGVPVAAEVARVLDAPLDVILVRKLGVRYQPELAMGAIGEDGVRVVNDDVVRTTGTTDAELAQVERRERVELRRRSERFRGSRTRAPVDGRTAVVVDDGIATGSTARAACEVARRLGAARVVLAVPVAPAASVDELRQVADEVVCLETPSRFVAVGQWYADFSQTTDDEVTDLLEQAAARRGRAGAGDDRAEEVDVVAGSMHLPGVLTVPRGAVGMVVFAHGSGSTRRSPRNRSVATVLNRARLGTLLFDLLSEDEGADRAKAFDIPLLGERLAGATRWWRARPEARGLPVGFFGASTGAGAALWAAAEPDLDVAAVVSRGGRPDLAGPRLHEVRSPTLLVVGGLDEAVLELNRRAASALQCEHRLEVVPGAGHLFEEAGTLHAAAEAARDWFLSYLARRHAGTSTR